MIIFLKHFEWLVHRLLKHLNPLLKCMTKLHQTFAFKNHLMRLSLSIACNFKTMKELIFKHVETLFFLDYLYFYNFDFYYTFKIILLCIKFCFNLFFNVLHTQCVHSTIHSHINCLVIHHKFVLSFFHMFIVACSSSYFCFRKTSINFSCLFSNRSPS